MNVRAASLLSFAAVLLTIFGIWLPEARHYWVKTPQFTSREIDQARVYPDDSRLDQLSGVPFDFPILDPAAPTVRDDAELVLRGKWNSPEFGIMDFRWPFSEGDLTKGWETQQLHFAALDHVDLLLVGYEATGDERYLKGARDIVNAWARYEQKAIFGRGYIWNDHAMAQRLLVLARYWRYIRHSALADEESARLLLQFVVRTGRIIAKPDQFTVRTNHGLMQNLTLLHIAAVFPGLADSNTFRDVAVDRLRLQLSFYQSPEGVVLEHSPGYHGLGVRILHGLRNYAGEIGEETAREAERRLELACRYLHAMQRPDQSLPMIGNTRAGPLHYPCAPAAEPATEGVSTTLFPVSGFAALRYGHPSPTGYVTESHTALTWSNFATGAHKHDDELSIVTWSRGLPLLTGAGYWTYGEQRERAAYSWRGANAPYLDKEASTRDRSAELMLQGSSGDIAFLQMARTNRVPAGRVERQLLTLGPDIWLTIDDASGQDGSLHSLWTLYPGWAVTSGEDATSFVARPEDGSPAAGASFASPSALDLKVLHASNQPFGGWVTLANSVSMIREASSIQVTGNAKAPIASLWSRDAKLGAGSLHWGHWNGSDDWSICLDGATCGWRIARTGRHLAILRAGQETSLEAESVPPQQAEREAIDGHYREAVRRYPYWRDLVSWRLYASAILLAGLLITEASLWLLRRRLQPRNPRLGGYVQLLHAAMPVIWTLVGVAIVFFYF